MKPNIAFIGLGVMGHRMLTNMRAHGGFTLVGGWDLAPVLHFHRVSRIGPDWPGLNGASGWAILSIWYDLRRSRGGRTFRHA